MATIYNRKKVAENSVTAGNYTAPAFTYKGFNSRQLDKGYKQYDIDLVKQDLINHFYIRKGEKLENPSFGTIIWDMIFEPFTDSAKKMIIKDVETIINYDPRITVNSVLVDATEQGLRIEAEVTYLPFNVSERMTFNFDKNQNIIN
jgi:phage baseplate assembly protein W